MHPSYHRLAELARRAHQNGRSLAGITPRDVELARLYSHAFRGHVIGAFHAARQALTPPALKTVSAEQCRVLDWLEDLADLAMDPILPDARALLMSFHRYDRGVGRVLAALQDQPDAATVSKHFQQCMEAITGCNGIHVTRDTEAPEHASFIVPNLGIRIVPLVYGDQHSWNLAYLAGQHRDVPFHLHHEAAEIHLGYSPCQGETILGGSRAAVSEGYAMPIPPGTLHGWVNHGREEHHVPFIYGSHKAGGWGVFFDVEPQKTRLEELEPAALDSPRMNGSIYLEREIASAEAASSSARRVIIPATATDRAGCGGLELGIARLTPAGLLLPVGPFRIVSVVRGAGMVEMAGIQQAIQAHDHFGIPAGMTARLCQQGNMPLVTLDAILRPPHPVA